MNTNYKSVLGLLQSAQGKIQENENTSVVESLRNYFKGYLDFSGKTTQKNYWIIFLILFVGQAIVGTTIATMAAKSIVNYALYNTSMSPRFWGTIVGVWVVISMLLSVSSSAMIARRSRDIGLQAVPAISIGVAYFVTHLVPVLQIFSWLMVVVAIIVGCYKKDGLKDIQVDFIKQFVEK